MHFDFEDENPMSPPRLRVEPGQSVVREACDLSLPVQAGEVTRGSAKACTQGSVSGPVLSLQGGPSQENLGCLLLPLTFILDL